MIPMNISLWSLLLAGLKFLAAVVYGMSGVMKVFLFDKISADVRSFGALPRKVWMALGILELVPLATREKPVAFGV